MGEEDTQPAAMAYVGLASPGQPGSWATESKVVVTFSFTNIIRKGSLLLFGQGGRTPRGQVPLMKPAIEKFPHTYPPHTAPQPHHIPLMKKHTSAPRSPAGAAQEPRHRRRCRRPRGCRSPRPFYRRRKPCPICRRQTSAPAIHAAASAAGAPYPPQICPSRRYITS
jgi:hypothetical protein